MDSQLPDLGNDKTNNCRVNLQIQFDNQANLPILEEMANIVNKILFPKLQDLPTGVDLKDPRISEVLKKINQVKSELEVLLATPEQEEITSSYTELERLELPPEMIELNETLTKIEKFFERNKPTPRSLKIKQMFKQLDDLTNYLFYILVDLPEDAFGDFDVSLQVALNKLRALASSIERSENSNLLSDME